MNSLCFHENYIHNSFILNYDYNNKKRARKSLLFEEIVYLCR